MLNRRGEQAKAFKKKVNAQADVKQLQAEIKRLTAELNEERDLRVHYEGEVEVLRCMNRQLRGARPRRGDDLILASRRS